MPRYHLAQFNVGRLRAPMDDPIMKGFKDALDPINALADAAPGFVWRLQTADGNATSIRPYADDDRMAVNLSAWESLEALQQFVYKGAHVGPLRDRRQWFEPIPDPILVLWWIPAGRIPSIVEAQARLETLRQRGPTADAFTFRNPFPSPDGQPVEGLDAAFCEFAS